MYPLQKQLPSKVVLNNCRKIPAVKPAINKNTRAATSAQKATASGNYTDPETIIAKASKIYTASTFARIDVAVLKAEVKDEWLELFQELAPDLDDAVNNCGQHVPCPIHGGKDGFKLFKDAGTTGGGICNTCGAYSDGIALLMAVNGWSFLETVRNIRLWLDGNW